MDVIRTGDYNLSDDDGSVTDTILVGQVTSVDVSRPAMFRRGAVRIELWDGRTKVVRFSRHQASRLEELLAAVIDAGRPARRGGYRYSDRSGPRMRPRASAISEVSSRPLGCLSQVAVRRVSMTSKMT